MTTTALPAITAADIDTTINHEPRIMDLRLAEALGFDRPRNIRKLIRTHVGTLKGFGEVCSERSKPSAAGGRPSVSYWLSKKQALFITAKSDTDRAALVTVQMVEVFDAVTSGETPAITVKAHRRTAPRRDPATPMQAGRGCMMLDGPGLVWFDRRYLPRPGDMALVINHDGQPMVAPVSDHDSRTFVPGRVWIERYPRPMRTWEHMVLIGVVTTPAGKPKRLAS